jgi:hypothetical protein
VVIIRREELCIFFLFVFCLGATYRLPHLEIEEIEECTPSMKADRGSLKADRGSLKADRGSLI